MKKPDDVITPPALERRPKDRRGYPIPYVTHVLDDGTPNFTGIDPRLVVECAKRRVCGLCAEPLGHWIAFVGGPLSMKTRTFNDPPVHEECGHYSMIVCPYLAMPNTAYATRHKEPIVRTVGQLLHKPPAPLMGITRGYDFDEHRMIFKMAAPKSLRVYPYGSNGDWYEPTPAVFAGLCAESERLGREHIAATTPRRKLTIVGGRVGTLRQ